PGGRAAPPFVSIGLQTGYQAPAGKPASVYRLLPGLTLTPTAQGKTAPLAKGITMGASATGEGMGFGVPIVRYPDGWVYSRTASTVQLSATSWRRTFQLDEIGGDAAQRYTFTPRDSRGANEEKQDLDATSVSTTARRARLPPRYTGAG